jgi:uncharacterized cupin superfamily protein
MTATEVQRWLDRYVKAWLTYDPEMIGDLFNARAAYFYSPYDQAVVGRDAIVASWLENRDTPGTYKAHYHIVIMQENVVVANGRSTYFEADGKTVEREFDNVFLIHFDSDGRCKEFTEWYMQKPED